MIRTMMWGLLLGVVFAAPVYAQGKKVVTINPDGSVTVTDQQGGSAQQLPPPSNNARRGPPFIDALPVEEQMKLRRNARPAAPSAPVSPQAPSAPDKEVAREKQPPARVDAPQAPQAKKPVAEKAAKPSTPKPEKKAVAKPAVKKPAPAAKPKPKEDDITRGEPAARDSIGRVDPKRAPTQHRVRGPLTADDAKRIALDVGPPAFGVDAYPADYNGRKVFQVIFRTEDGERYVLVDRNSGEIVRD